MPKAIKVYNTGDPDVMKWEDIESGTPAANEIMIRHTAVGLNFIDVYFRKGVYPAPEFPFVPGLEGAGIVEQTGSNVESLELGDRVAYASPPLGAYAEERVIAADRVVKIPAEISNTTAAAMMLQGMTVQYLLRQVFKVKEGDTILFHAAAGGVGLIACQWAKHLGATVIGTVSSAQKADIARQHGCDHPIIYTQEDFLDRVRDITDGKGVPVVYDSVGATTFEKSLDCLQPKGYMVSFGQSSGEVKAFNPVLLSTKGSLFLTRPTLMTYTADPADLVSMAEELCSMVVSGAITIPVKQKYALSDAVQAHRDLEGRKTHGSTVLVV